MLPDTDGYKIVPVLTSVQNMCAGQSCKGLAAAISPAVVNSAQDSFVIQRATLRHRTLLLATDLCNLQVEDVAGKLLGNNGQDVLQLLRRGRRCSQQLLRFGSRAEHESGRCGRRSQLLNLLLCQHKPGRHEGYDLQHKEMLFGKFQSPCSQLRSAAGEMLTCCNV